MKNDNLVSILKFTSLAFMLSGSVAAHAITVPAELKSLIPVGGKSVRMTGETSTGKSCRAEFFMDAGGFLATVRELHDGETVSGSVVGFSLDRHHDLVSIDSGEEGVMALIEIPAEEQYHGERRARLDITREFDAIVSVRITEYARARKGWRVVSSGECRF